MSPRAPEMVLAAALAAGLLAGCGRQSRERPAGGLPRPFAVTVLADSGLGVGLPPARLAPPPKARLTLVRIAADRGDVQPPLPQPEPAEPPTAGGARAPEDRLPVDDLLRPPVPRGSAQLRLAGARGGWVELDVLVNEDGEVADAQVAAAGGDTALVRTALEAARRVRYLPATRAGRAVAVWCRQRFDVGR